MPKALRSLSVMCLRAAMSTSSAWKVIEYFSSPRDFRKISSGLSAYKEFPTKKKNDVGSEPYQESLVKKISKVTAAAIS